MSGGMTAYSEGRVIDYVFGTSYVSLHTASPPTSANEVSGGAYARQQFSYTKSGGDPTTAANTAAINYPTATAAWGTIASAAFWDAATAGNMLEIITLSASKPVNSGDSARFAAGQLTVTAD